MLVLLWLEFCINDTGWHFILKTWLPDYPSARHLVNILIRKLLFDTVSPLT